MEVIHETPEPDDIDENPRPICMIRMSPHEALATIQSLTAQLISHDPNTGRYEKYADDGTYFSIAIQDKKRVRIIKQVTENADEITKALRDLSGKGKVDLDLVNNLTRSVMMIREMERFARNG